jgi:hypothetical protein
MPGYAATTSRGERPGQWKIRQRQNARILVSLLIANFPMAPRKVPMQPAASGLDKVVARSLRKAPAAEAPLLAWPVACGSAVAARTRALEFVEGILRVEVPDAGWRRELQALAPRYVAALNRYLKDTVSGVEFVVAGRKKTASVPDHKPTRRRRA